MLKQILALWCGWLTLCPQFSIAQCPTTTYPLCSGETYTLTAQSGLTNIQWQKDDGSGYMNISGATNATYTATAIGKYRYTATDANNCAITLCCPLEIVGGTNCSSSCPTTTYPICSGETYTLTAQAGLTNIQWQKDDGAGYVNISGATNTIYTATTIGKYRYLAKDANWCDIDLCCPLEIVAGTNCPSSCPTTTYPICSGESYTLTAQAGLTNIQWQLDNGGGFSDILGATNTTYTATTLGKYRYIAKDGSNCDILLCCPFELVAGTCTPPCPTPQYNLCSGESYRMTAQAGLTNMQWQVDSGSGFGNIAGATDTFYNVSTGGRYKYVATDANGCAIELCCPLHIVVYPTPSTPVVSSPLFNICPATRVNLTAVSNALPNGGDVYEWHVANNKTSPLVTMPNIVGAGMYYLFLKGTHNCYSASVPVLVQIQVCCKPMICLPVTVVRN